MARQAGRQECAMRGQEGGGGRAVRCLVAAAGLLAALSAAGTVFLLGQWRELSAAVRQLQEDAALRPPAEPSALRHHHRAHQREEPTAPSGSSSSGGDLLDGDAATAGRSKRSQRGRGCAKLRLENDDAFWLMSYSVVPVGGTLARLPSPKVRGGPSPGGAGGEARRASAPEACRAALRSTEAAGPVGSRWQPRGQENQGCWLCHR